MARITVEDCLQKVNNRFALIHMASKRVRQLRKGAEPKISSKNRDIVVSLREIAAGEVVGVGPGDYKSLPEGDAYSLPEEAVSPKEENTGEE
jgi:DNA-directed RNA polymerase subunit omega